MKESECFSVTAGSILMDHDRLQEAIAVINHGVRLIRGFNLRNTQIIALWVYLSNNGERGRLGQISTGEGKSLIIACLASIYSLGGRLVHVVTSSSPLAERDVEEQREIFDLFKRTASNNCDQKVLT